MIFCNSKTLVCWFFKLLNYCCEITLWSLNFKIVRFTIFCFSCCLILFLAIREVFCMMKKKTNWKYFPLKHCRCGSGMPKFMFIFQVSSSDVYSDKWSENHFLNCLTFGWQKQWLNKIGGNNSIWEIWDLFLWAEIFFYHLQHRSPIYLYLKCCNHLQAMVADTY